MYKNKKMGKVMREEQTEVSEDIIQESINRDKVIVKTSINRHCYEYISCNI